MIQGLGTTLNDTSFAKKKPKSVLEIAGLIAACIVLACSFYTIFIYYYISVARNGNEQTFPCNESTVPEVTLCSLHGIGALTGSGCNERDCSTVYSGSICTDVLRAWQSCAINQPQQNLYIQSGLDQSRLESELDDYLDIINNEDCQQTLLTFLCLYTYPLCDCTTQNTHKPTRDMCREIGNTDCMQQLINLSNYSISIDCSHLPSEDAVGSSCTTGSPLNATNVTCNTGFIVYNNTCWPECGVWIQDDSSVVLISAKLLFTSAGCIIVLILLILLACEWKRVFKFPNYLPILVAIDYLAIASFIIVSSQLGFLFCDGNHLDISQNTSTAYCTATGVAFYYLHIQMIIIWFIHISFIFYTMTFPSHAKEHREDPMTRATSTLCVIIGFFLPGLVPFIILVLKQTTYIQYNHPSSFCFMKNFPLQLYTLVAPGIVLLSIGSVLCLISLWIIHKRQGIFIAKKQLKFKHVQLSGHEKRTFLILISILVYSTLIMIYIIHLGVNYNQLYSGMKEYFNCEKNGKNSNCSKANITKYTSGYVELAVHIVMMTIPLTILFYMVDTKHMRQVICRLKTHNRDIYSTAGGLSRKIKARPSTQKSISRQYILSPFEMDVTQTIPEEDEDNEL